MSLVASPPTIRRCRQKYQRSISNGLQALLSYTWSHSLDFGSNNSALPVIRGNSDFDVRNNFQAGASWDIPSKGLDRVMTPVLENWGIDLRALARTAFPVTLQGQSLIDSTTGSTYNSGVDLVPNAANPTVENILKILLTEVRGKLRLRQRTRHRIRQRLLRGTVLQQRNGPLHVPGLEHSEYPQKSFADP